MDHKLSFTGFTYSKTTSEQSCLIPANILEVILVFFVVYLKSFSSHRISWRAIISILQIFKTVLSSSSFPGLSSVRTFHVPILKSFSCAFLWSMKRLVVAIQKNIRRFGTEASIPKNIYKSVKAKTIIIEALVSLSN